MPEKHWLYDVVVGDEVSYRNVNLWFTYRGIVESISGETALVRWNANPGRLSNEWLMNLISWR